ncbi:MAG: SH3 domain-containing protein [Pseudomonadota bacterium]
MKDHQSQYLGDYILRTWLLVLSLVIFVVLLSSCQSVGPLIGNQMVASSVSNQAHRRADNIETTTTREEGLAKKNSNVRSGPSTKNKKVGRLPKGTRMTVLDTQGKWLNIEADTDNGFIEGWVYAPLVEVSTITIVNKSQPTQTSNKQIAGGKLSNVYYAGYSKDFLPVKQMMKTGNLKGVEAFFSQREEKIRKESKTKYDLINNIGLLRWMERGTLGLDTRKLGNAVEGFENAEIILNVRKESSQASDILSSFTTFTAETLTGNEEFMEYPGEGYEKVLMLNYKSIAYLLDGKRKAYNTTRRAIDWQNIEKQKFDAELRDVNQEKSKQSSASNANDGWKKNYQQYDKIANKVASAYVNPFGYYVAGMVQEFESKDDRSLRDNARISYQKALELNPASKVLKQAARDMKNKYNKNKRLVHIVVADGFVPEKKMLVYNIPSNNGVIPIKLTLYEPIPSPVTRIEVQTASGKRLAKLSVVADVEAITMRHQKDSEGFRSLRVALSIARSIGVNEATKRLGLFGALIGSAVNSLAAPDMRSWMSLPATLQAARIKISSNISKVKIVSYDKKGRRLASKTVKINKQSDNFIYARSIENQLYVNGSKELWL